MTHGEILEYLGYAAAHELQVRITTHDGGEIVGIPTSVDSHPTANEVYLRIFGQDEREIGLGISQIAAVELR